MLLESRQSVPFLKAHHYTISNFASRMVIDNNVYLVESHRLHFVLKAEFSEEDKKTHLLIMKSPYE